MSSVDDLRKQKGDLESKIQQTEQTIGQGLSWKDAQFYIEKYKEEIRVIDNQIAKSQLGEDAVSELKKRRKGSRQKCRNLTK